MTASQWDILQYQINEIQEFGLLRKSQREGGRGNTLMISLHPCLSDVSVL